MRRIWPARYAGEGVESCADSRFGLDLALLVGRTAWLGSMARGEYVVLSRVLSSLVRLSDENNPSRGYSHFLHRAEPFAKLTKKLSPLAGLWCPLAPAEVSRGVCTRPVPPLYRAGKTRSASGGM
ncbi:hypothetical protein CEB3_c46290 [Peptococcaceae bacterium CEB3]|nr:hypothetical protein CEB3_c46290 [Peptococcaceae bacterium CEB3]